MRKHNALQFEFNMVDAFNLYGQQAETPDSPDSKPVSEAASGESQELKLEQRSPKQIGRTWGAQGRGKDTK